MMKETIKISDGRLFTVPAAVADEYNRLKDGRMYPMWKELLVDLLTKHGKSGRIVIGNWKIADIYKFLIEKGEGAAVKNIKKLKSSNK